MIFLGVLVTAAIVVNAVPPQYDHLSRTPLTQRTRPLKPPTVSALPLGSAASGAPWQHNPRQTLPKGGSPHRQGQRGPAPVQGWLDDASKARPTGNVLDSIFPVPQNPDMCRPQGSCKESGTVCTLIRSLTDAGAQAFEYKDQETGEIKATDYYSLTFPTLEWPQFWGTPDDGLSWCISLTNYAKMINKIGCWRVRINCRAMDEATILSKNPDSEAWGVNLMAAKQCIKEQCSPEGRYLAAREVRFVAKSPVDGIWEAVNDPLPQTKTPIPCTVQDMKDDLSRIMKENMVGTIGMLPTKAPPGGEGRLTAPPGYPGYMLYDYKDGVWPPKDPVEGAADPENPYWAKETGKHWSGTTAPPPEAPSELYAHAWSGRTVVCFAGVAGMMVFSAAFTTLATSRRLSSVLVAPLNV